MGGEAEINTAAVHFTGDGVIYVEGEGELTDVLYNYNPTGQVVVGGETRSLKSVHEYTADGGLETGGKPDYTLTFFDRECDDTFVCTVRYPNPYHECPEVGYYLNDCEIVDNECNPRSGAFLAAITSCQQKFILPDKDRHPRVPKVWR